MSFYMECTSSIQFQLATSAVTGKLLKALSASQTSIARNKTILPLPSSLQMQKKVAFKPSPSLFMSDRDFDSTLFPMIFPILLEPHIV